MIKYNNNENKLIIVLSWYLVVSLSVLCHNFCMELKYYLCNYEILWVNVLVFLLNKVIDIFIILRNKKLLVMGVNMSFTWLNITSITLIFILFYYKNNKWGHFL